MDGEFVDITGSILGGGPQARKNCIETLTSTWTSVCKYVIVQSHAYIHCIMTSMCTLY